MHGSRLQHQDPIADQLLMKLANGGSDLVKLRRDIGCRPNEFANALWALRADLLVDFDTLELTRKGALRAGELRIETGVVKLSAEAARPRNPISVPSAASQGAQGDAKLPPAAPQTMAPRPGWTRTRSPAEVIRRISAELDLADPRKGMAAMVQHWPEAARRMEALAASRSTTLYALIGQALAAGVDLIEARPSA